uniref:sulfurtransferase-like selenium metabolism protein YedF n=1 Tax=Clostridium sp. NkU-1 TaxID=1095009 RepID=UPI000B0E01CC
MPEKKGLVAVLSSDQMGGGNEELGRILMKGFVYALTKLEELPETVLLYNGGARLSVEGSQSLEDLKSLEAQGVEILTCGTCLNHYELSDKLQVGSVTNMYEIVEKWLAPAW